MDYYPRWSGGAVEIESAGGLITLNDTSINTFGGAGGLGGGANEVGSGGDVDFLVGNVLLDSGQVTINTGSAGGSIGFGTQADPVNVSAASNEDLVLVAGGGSITFEGTVVQVPIHLVL